MGLRFPLWSRQRWSRRPPSSTSSWIVKGAGSPQLGMSQVSVILGIRHHPGTGEQSGVGGGQGVDGHGTKVRDESDGGRCGALVEVVPIWLNGNRGILWFDNGGRVLDGPSDTPCLSDALRQRGWGLGANIHLAGV